MARERLSAVRDLLPGFHVNPACALREALREGYTPGHFRDDLLAGLVVGVVALPLNLALAIATGLRPENGLYTAIIAGFVIALLGGSRYQISGPTAAFVVVLSPITAQWGLAGLALASAMAGVILMLMGLLRMGRLVEFIPYPVSTGFTAGIAVVIALLQVRDFLGLDIETMHLRLHDQPVTRMPDATADRVRVLWDASLQKFGNVEDWSGVLGDAAMGAVTLAMLVLLPRLLRRIPAPLVALPLAALLGAAVTWLFPGVSIETIATRYGTPEAPHGLPATLPPLLAPWNEPGPLGPDGRPTSLTLSLDLVRALLPSAFTIAMLGAIASLLSAVVADGLRGTRHDPDAELLAQGVGNVVAPFFAGFAATGGIARTATNARAGARSPIAAVVHCGFLACALLLMAPLLGSLPMASLAALLLVVARQMADTRHVVFVLRHAPRSDAGVMLVCFGLTVVFDMVIAVSAGVVLAALLFIRRMAETSSVRLVGQGHPAHRQPMPPGVLIYDIGGPLFFGAAARALGQLTAPGDTTRAVVLDLTDVPALDATGLVNLDSMVSRLEKRGIFTVLAGAQPAVLRVLGRAGWLDRHGRLLAVAGSVEAGVEIARAAVERSNIPENPDHSPATR
jgi:SulP family sulfate permease